MSHLFYAIIMLKCMICGQKERSKSQRISCEVDHAMGTHLTTNTSRRKIMTSCEESSLQDKNGSWSDVTS